MDKPSRRALHRTGPELCAEATDQERRVLVEELPDVVAVFPDDLEVTVKGASRLNLTLDEVGLTGGRQFRGVGGPKSPNCHPEWRVKPWPPAM